MSIADLLAVILIVLVIVGVLVRRIEPLVGAVCAILVVLLWAMLDGRIVS